MKNISSYAVKFKILVSIQHFLENFKIVSEATTDLGTFYGEELNYLLNNLSKIKEVTIIDVGANIGDWSLSMSEILKNNKIESRIISIEPIPIFFDLLSKKNIDNFFPMQIGISNECETIEITQLGGGASIYFNESTLSKKIKRTFKVNAVRGDTIVENLNAEPDYIKIDTDGGDLDVLKSFSNTLTGYHPVIQFEHTFRFAKKAGYTLKQIIKFLNEFEYSVYVIDKNSMLKKIKVPRLEVLNHQTKNFMALPNKHSNIIKRNI